MPDCRTCVTVCHLSALLVLVWFESELLPWHGHAPCSSAVHTDSTHICSGLHHLECHCKMYSITNCKYQVLYCQCVLLFVAHCLRQEVHGAPRVETGLFVCVNGASIQCTDVHLLHQVGAPARASTTVYFGVLMPGRPTKPFVIQRAAAATAASTATRIITYHSRCCL